MQWTQNVCRICGEVKAACHLIFNKDPQNDLVAKLKKCLKLEVFKDDYKPKQMCNDCVIKLDDFSRFLAICYETNEKFETIWLNRQQWPDENSIIDYTQQKLSVIVNPKTTIEPLECPEIDLYKETLPLDNLNNEMLPILENPDYLTPDYLAASHYEVNKTFYQETTVLRHSSTYHQDDVINYSCQQELAGSFPDSAQQFADCPPKRETKKPRKEPFQCPHCDKEFLRRVTLNGHIAVVHTKVRPYVCDICGKSYAIKCDLTSHKKVHTDRNKCDFCPRSFSAPSKLQRHMRTHTKDRPFACDFKNCSKSFSDKRNLDGHKSVHSDVYGFNCKECGRAFKTRNRLKQHGRAHAVSKPFICDVCFKEYKYKSNLVFHLKKHNGYFCPYCKKDCERVVKLIRHKRECPDRNS